MDEREDSTRWRWWTGDYPRWLVADTLASVASGLHLIGTPLLALAVTGNPTLAGVVGAVTSAAVVVGTLPAGVIADRFPRRRVMVLGGFATAAAYGTGVALYIVGSLGTGALIALAASGSLLGTLSAGATSAALRQIVPAARLPQAMSVSQGRDAAISLGSGPAAGALFALAPIMPWFVSTVAQAGKAMVSATLSASLAPTADHDGGRGSLRWLTAGLRILARVRLLGTLAVVASVLNFAGSGVVLAVILGLRVGGQPPHVVGLTSTAMGAGALLGAILSGFLVSRVATGKLLIVGFLLQAVALGSLSFIAEPWVVLTALFVAFCAVPAVNAAAIGFIMAITPTHLQGRVGSAVSMLSLVTTPVATMLAGWGVAELGMQTTVGVFASSFAVAIVLAMSSRIRLIPRPKGWARYGERQVGTMMDD